MRRVVTFIGGPADGGWLPLADETVVICWPVATLEGWTHTVYQRFGDVAIPVSGHETEWKQ